jgi:hypothetical protein
LIGNAVGFDFVCVAGLADVQLRLNRARFQQSKHGLISNRAVEVERGMAVKAANPPHGGAFQERAG